MKKNKLIFLMMLSAFLFAAQNCGDDEKALTEDDVNEEIVTSCHGCHSEDSEIGMKILAAQAGYDNSGHKNGPRGWIELTDVVYDASGTLQAGDTTLETLFHGSNAAYTNATPCSNCHTHNGFVERVKAGQMIEKAETDTKEIVVGAPAPIGCFTCHEPHKNGNFSLRTTNAVTLLVDDTVTFDRGLGNLCVHCHQSRTAASSVDTTFATPATPSGHWGPHHGPQGDFLMGANGYEFTGKTYSTNDVHYDAKGDSPANSCVNCHRYTDTNTNGDRYNSNLETGNHGMYLTANVHGSMTDRVDVCWSQCHSTDIPDPKPRTAKFTDVKKPATADWDGDGTTETILKETQGLADKLYTYFIDPANFAGTNVGACNTAPVAGPIATSGISTKWRLGWDFQAMKNDWDATASTGTEECVMTKAQAGAFWNFKYYTEDHSGGVHFPTYAAQLLYDSLEAVGDTTIGATRP
ncbi:MAG: hypothetical protein OEZ22_02895 [Spirochaetia bacterium]|nr:hypothetical protein [Spirochaetia bacterium]